MGRGSENTGMMGLQSYIQKNGRNRGKKVKSLIPSDTHGTKAASPRAKLQASRKRELLVQKSGGSTSTAQGEPRCHEGPFRGPTEALILAFDRAYL
jgi:hypothetical protein